MQNTSPHCHPWRWQRKMKVEVRPAFPTLPINSSQVSTAGAINAAHSVNRPESTFGSGRVVQPNGFNTFRVRGELIILTMRKFAHQAHSRCEWVHEEYSLRFEDLPQKPSEPGQRAFGLN